MQLLLCRDASRDQTPSAKEKTPTEQTSRVSTCLDSTRFIALTSRSFGLEGR
ncbi:hypothetical protein K239x_41450 [Planctomycetes bacterium K23_9]|uniref:Uncharacterized protein n=1 Tax=Stieleria marina TaxID=1930275 RepID=A0A517NYD1_9BACT|nr:hypothetical protein K239x_41450 [Planctomycetes bacterium K23_9]